MFLSKRQRGKPLKLEKKLWVDDYAPRNVIGLQYYIQGTNLNTMTLHSSP